MAIYGTILREDSSNRREYRYGMCSLIPLPTCLSLSLPLYSTFLRPRLVDAPRIPPFSPSLSQPLRKFESAREKVNDPSGDFQRSGDWNHRWDSSRLNSPVCRWYKRKKEKTNRPILGYVPGEVAGCRAWFDPWKWLSGIEPSRIDEDLMLIRAGRPANWFFFFYFQLFSQIYGGGEGEEVYFFHARRMKNWRIIPRVVGEIFNSILCSNLCSAH